MNRARPTREGSSRSAGLPLLHCNSGEKADGILVTGERFSEIFGGGQREEEVAAGWMRWVGGTTCRRTRPSRHERRSRLAFCGLRRSRRHEPLTDSPLHFIDRKNVSGFNIFQATLNRSMDEQMVLNVVERAIVGERIQDFLSYVFGVLHDGAF